MAVISIRLRKTVVGQGYLAKVDVDITNQGHFTETFNAIAHADLALPIGDEVAIEERQVTNLEPGETRTLLFQWDTTSPEKGDYIISAVVDAVPGEVDTTDNTLVGDSVSVTIPGDVNGDAEVNTIDLGDISTVYGRNDEAPDWDANCDINDDSQIDVLDLFIHGKNFDTSQGQIPVAVIYADPNPPIVKAGTDLLFYGTNSYDPDGQVTAYFFDFGDGSDSGWLSYPTASVSHRYETQGQYSVKLKVRDNDGLESEWCVPTRVTVTDVPWWNANWAARKPIVIESSNTQDQLDYSIPFSIPYDTDMRTDFGDLRFIYYDEVSMVQNELNFWIQEKTDGSFAIVWVKIPIIQALSTTIIYAYYKNPTVTTTSNGESTFWFFDDFDNGDYVSDGWQAWNSWGDGGQWTESGTLLQQVGETTGDTIISHSIPEISNYEVQAKAKPEYWTEDAVFVGTGDAVTPGVGQEMAVGIDWGGPVRYWGITNTTGDGGPVGAWAYIEAPINLDEWYTFELVANGTSYGWVTNSTGTYFVGSPKGPLPPINGVHFKANPMQKYASYDWIFVRKYAYREPTFLIGNEESRPPSLVGYWKFDEGSGTVTSDNSGNGNTGTLVNGPTWVDGKCGNAVSGDGVDDYVEIAENTDLNPHTSDWTVSAWVNIARLGSDTSVPGFVVLGKRQTEYDSSLTLIVSDQTSETSPARFAFIWDGHNTIGGSVTPLMNVFGWHFVAGVRRGGELYVYVDGVGYGPNNAPGSGFDGFSSTTDVNSSTPIHLLHHGAWNQYYQGVIDEVKIYNYARTAEEIWNDYISAMPAPRVLAWGWSLHVAEGIDREWTFLNGTTFTFRSWLQSKGYSVFTEDEAFPDCVVTLSRLQKFSAILLYANTLAQPGNDACDNMITEYVNQGGGLIIPTNYADPAITINHAFGFDWIEEPWSYFVDATITDPTHPVMQGITELPKAGGVFLDWDALINEAPLPPGTAVLARSTGSPPDKIALIAFQYGIGRVVVGPADGLMRPYGPTNMDWWDVTAEPAIENRLLLNAISRVASAL